MSAPDLITMYADGLCEPNPGGVGVAAYCAFPGETSGREGAARPAPLVVGARVIGRWSGMTNNVAEYRAVIGALKWANLKAAASPVTIRTDSQLVVEQVSGAWGCNVEHLVALRDQARTLIAEHGHVRLEWVPREDTAVADALARREYQRVTGRRAPERARKGPGPVATVGGRTVYECGHEVAPGTPGAGPAPRRERACPICKRGRTA